MNIEDLKEELQDQEEETEKPIEIQPLTKEQTQAVRKRLLYFRTIYYLLGSGFMIAGISFFFKKEPLTGVIFLAISSVVSLFGHICESAIRNL